MRRLAKDPSNPHPEYQICSDHAILPITRQVNWIGTGNKTRKDLARFYVPESVGMHSDLNNRTTSTRKFAMETFQQRLEEGDEMTTCAW
jgi:hypothetical protein